jgi:ubiquinone/menaquinone biosynthesis C-methylase UbiE
MAMGFMRAKHLFVAGELGIFEALADGPRSLGELARSLRIPHRTARIVVDAVTALGFLCRDGDRYQNAPTTQAFLSGCGPQDLRPFIRFWNRISYRRWLALEDSVRRGRGVAGEFNFTPEEQKIFSEGVEGFTNNQAVALVDAYDFGPHHHVLDLGGGTGSFLRRILERHHHLQGTLFELPGAAALARQKLSATALEKRMSIIEGDFLKDAIPGGHDAFLVANVIHVLDGEQNQQLSRRVRDCAPPGARFLLVDFWTNAGHTEPLFAALMAGEFLVVGGNGDVYSVEEGRSWLEQAGWHFVEHKPLTGPASLIIAEAADE